MWRQNAFPENQDVDQSISDEDDEFDRVTYDHRCVEDLRSLCRRGSEEEWHVTSELEIPEGKGLPSSSARKLNAGGIDTNLENFSSEDEVEFEMHEFQNEAELIHSCQRNDTSGSYDEAISDDEKEEKVISSFSFKSAAAKSHKYQLHDWESENQDGGCKWSAFLKEAEELAYLHENAGTSLSLPTNSITRKFHKGCDKTKPKFSICFQSHKDRLSLSSLVKGESTKSSEVSQIPARLEALECRVTEHSMAELLEGLHEKLSEASQSPGVLALAHRGTKHSMTELLEGLKVKNGPSEGTSNMNSNMKERRFFAKSTLSSLGDRTLDNEDPVENYGMSSEDEDANQNHLNLPKPSIKAQTMVDQFQEAFHPAAVDGEGGLFPIGKQAGARYYGRLQEVMQKEKDKHMKFLKRLQMGASPNDEPQCIDVQLLSRYLEAKLTVCRCTVLGNSMGSQCLKSPSELVDGGASGDRIFIFSPRICNNVGLEVGNSIRVHHPCNGSLVQINALVWNASITCNVAATGGLQNSK